MAKFIEQLRWLPMMLPRMAVAALLGALGVSHAAAQIEVRVKDLTEVAGMRTEKLLGMGLVTGLNGTGGRNPSTRQYALNLWQRFGNRADPLQRTLVRDDAKEKTGSLSVVTVTAELPAFAKCGSKVDVLVATFDDASNLQGGVLQQTPLVGVDGAVYAVADGPVSTGGFTAGGQAATVQKNHPTSGRIPNGANVEKEVCTPPLGADGRVRLLLRQADYETASRIAAAINEKFPGLACLADAGTVDLDVRPERGLEANRLVAAVGGIGVTPDVRAKVTINERTGTIVIGENVRLSRVALTHGSLAVITSETPQVAQPAPFSRGETTVVPRTQVDVQEEKNAISVLGESATVGDLAQALNALGATPRDLSAIFQQLKAAGALHADLEFD